MSDLRPKSTKFDFGWSSATDPVGGDGGLLPLPKNHCRSRPFGPRPRCSQAFFFPNLGMSQSLFTDLLHEINTSTLSATQYVHVLSPTRLSVRTYALPTMFCSLTLPLYLYKRSFVVRCLCRRALYW